MQIISQEHPIAVWRDGHLMGEGQYAFPFEIELPDWLPASISIAEPEHSIFMQIKYMLIA